jgi:hypothetical protein
MLPTLTCRKLSLACKFGLTGAAKGNAEKRGACRGLEACHDSSSSILFGHLRQRERCHNARAGFASVAQVCLTAPPRLLVCLRNAGWPWFRQPPITQQELRRLAMRARFRSRDAWHSLGCCSATRQLFRENQPGGTAKKKRNTRENEKHGCWWGISVGSHSRSINRLNWGTNDSVNPSGPGKCNHTRTFSEAIMQPGVSFPGSGMNGSKGWATIENSGFDFVRPEH